MLIDLSELLSLEDKVKSAEIPLEMEEFTTRLVSYPITDKKEMSFKFTGLGNRKAEFEADIDVTLLIPCDRCLEDARENIKISVSKEINLGDTDITRRDALDEMVYITGTTFDAEKFAYGEILVNLPMKVLCSENCKGICNRCGTNLNHEDCGCDTTELDPRMAKALEVFKSFKEV